MRTLRFLLTYDGTDFHGWQRQPGLRTIQESVEAALAELTGSRVEVTASGRTDAGVHALGQVAHAHVDTRLSCEVLARGLNALVPADVRVLAVEDAPQSFHATLDAKSKRYRYVIDNAPVACPMRRRFSWHVPRRLDEERMRCAAGALLGRHDFRSFETEWPNRMSSVRTITDIAVERLDDVIHIEVEADGFLYNMVRAIVGTLVLIGSGRRPESFAADALAAQDRRAAGPNAPARGLFLLVVRYRLNEAARQKGN